MITRTLHLNLSRDDRETDRRAIGMLFGLPAGHRVALFFGNRRFYDAETANLLSEYVSSLHFDVQGSTPDVIDAWAKSIENGSMARRWSA